MYNITITHPVVGQQPLKLKTEHRHYARVISLLGEENHVKVEVVAEVAPRVVKFKGVEPKAPVKK